MNDVAFSKGLSLMEENPSAKVRPEKGPDSPSAQVQLDFCAPGWESRTLEFQGQSDASGRASCWSPEEWYEPRILRQAWCPFLHGPVR